MDTQLCYLDVIWRDRRQSIDDPLRSPSGSNRVAILRRERFQFDSVFCGSDATIRLSASARDRVLQALNRNSDLCFTCLACGEVTTPDAGLEPPLASIIGDHGGHGVLSATVEEVFRYIEKRSRPSQSRPDTRTTFGRAAWNPVMMGGSAATITLSAVIISGGHIADLFGDGLTTPSAARRNSDGRYMFYNVNRLRLQSASDFERVVGVLLGRRAALQQLANADVDVHNLDFSQSVNAWASNTLVAANDDSCMLLTLSVVGGNLAGSGESNFSFICPAGVNWRLPGKY